jgi:hypothetical protein
MASPITGTDGNVEFLLHATAPPGPAPADPAAEVERTRALVDGAIHDAGAR